MKKGVYTATKKDGTLYYRSSITFQNKHISLGSFSSEKLAATAYLEAEKLLRTHVLTLDRFEENCTLSFAKWVCLLNFRDNGMYIKISICIFLLYHNDSQFYKLEVVSPKSGRLRNRTFVQMKGLENLFSVPQRQSRFHQDPMRRRPSICTALKPRVFQRQHHR